jgi:hypothetical protein
MQDTLSEGTARATQLAPSAVTASAVGGSANRSVVGRVSPTTSAASNAAQSLAPRRAPRRRRDSGAPTWANSRRLHTAGPPVVYRSGILCPTLLAPPGRAMRARRRKVARPDRVSGNEARSPPARSVCFPHPVRMSSPGVRAAAEKVCLEIYNEYARLGKPDSLPTHARASEGW